MDPQPPQLQCCEVGLCSLYDVEYTPSAVFLKTTNHRVALYSKFHFSPEGNCLGFGRVGLAWGVGSARSPPPPPTTRPVDKRIPGVGATHLLCVSTQDALHDCAQIRPKAREQVDAENN